MFRGDDTLHPCGRRLLGVTMVLMLAAACGESSGGPRVEADPLAPVYQRSCQPGDFTYDDPICGPTSGGGQGCGRTLGNGQCYRTCQSDADCDEPTRPHCRTLGLYDRSADSCNGSVLICAEGRQNDCAVGQPDDLLPAQPVDPCVQHASEEECQADAACQPLYLVNAVGQDGAGQPCFHRQPPESASRLYNRCTSPDTEAGLHEFWLTNPDDDIADPNCIYLASSGFVPTGWAPCGETIPLCP